MPPPITIMTRAETRKVWLRKSAPGRIGSAARRSARMKSSSPQAETAKSASARRSSQAAPVETSPSASMAGISASSSAPMPNQSMRTLRGGGRSQGMITAIAAKATTAIGRIAQKTQRQLSASTISPPSSGPISPPMPKTAAKRPMYLPRSEGGKRSPETEKALPIRMPPPMPCSARRPISISIEVAKPQSAVAPAKSTRPLSRKGLRP